MPRPNPSLVATAKLEGWLSRFKALGPGGRRVEADEVLTRYFAEYPDARKDEAVLREFMKGREVVVSERWKV